MSYCTKLNCGTIKFTKKMDMYINFDYNICKKGSFSM